MKLKYNIIVYNQTQQAFPAENYILDEVRESGEVFYRTKMSGDLVFYNDHGKGITDYDFIMSGTPTRYDNTLFAVEILKKCNGVWVREWMGHFTRLNAEINEDRCTVKVTPVVYDEYSCLLGSWENEYNIMEIDLMQTACCVNGYPTETTSGSHVSLPIPAIPNHNTYMHYGTGEPRTELYIMPDATWSITQITSTIASCSLINTYIIMDSDFVLTRELLHSPYVGATFVIPTSGGWTDTGVDVTIGGNQYRKFARPLTATPSWTNLQSDSCVAGGATFTALGTFGNNAYTYPDIEMDNGRRLTHCIGYLANKSCISIPYTGTDADIISSFLKSSVNPVTGENPNSCQRLTMYHKNDVTVPNISGFTITRETYAEISFKDLMDQLKEVFQLYWKIENWKIKIEHISYWETVLNGVDLSAIMNERTGNKYVKKMNKYSFDMDKFPSNEEFKFSEAQSIDFVGTDIAYNDTLKYEKQNKKTHNAALIATDLRFAIDYPDKFSKNGFFMLAIDSSAYVLIEEGLLSHTNFLNAHLSWANLHHNYWRHERPVSEFTMNDETTAAITVRKNKIQEGLVVPLCCDTDLDTEKNMKSELGWGRAVSVKRNLKKDEATVNLRL